MKFCRFLPLGSSAPQLASPLYGLLEGQQHELDERVPGQLLQAPQHRAARGLAVPLDGSHDFLLEPR